MANAKKELDLLRSYRQIAQPRTRFLDTFYAVPCILLAVCIVAWGAVSAANLMLSHSIDRMTDWLEAPETVVQYEEATAKQQENEAVMHDVEEVNTLTDNLATYPAVSSALVSRIREAGGSQVGMNLTGYHAETGELLFEAHSANVIDIPDYVLKLQNTGLFDSVSYTGYEYDETQQYVLSLNCILKSGAGREGAAS